MKYRQQQNILQKGSRQYKLQQDTHSCLTLEQFNVLNNIISLWQRYVMWRRALFLSKLEQSPNTNAVEERLNQVPVDFYNTLRVFFGERLAEQFLTTFQSYTIIQTKLMNALINGDQEAVNEFARDLYAKADDLASLLSNLPYWQQDQWKALLYQDISASLTEYRAAMTGEYELEISIFERILLNASEIAEYMSQGIFYAGQNPILLRN